ncbi:hypothetical protein [Streptomyces platensis]|uniref:hypothetical protein n=1 Tax=Streptomyces platensis TaxID=58346 RepID=UPI0027E591DB|nr:hypothetical protein [Streptomyces platensis]
MSEGTRMGEDMWKAAGTAPGAGMRRAAEIPLDQAVNEIEGFLLREAEKDRARTRAEAFCAGLPWLTDTQRREVELRYCQDQRDTSRAYLERIATRSAALRAEYEGVYRALRRRLITALLTGTLAVAVLVAMTAVGMSTR